MCRCSAWWKTSQWLLWLLLLWLVVGSLVPGGLLANDRFQSIAIGELELAEAYSTVAGPLVRASSSKHAGEFLIRAGDLLADGAVERIIFISPRLAVVRLEQRVWPPDDRGPYREILRVLGWQTIVGEVASVAAVPEPETFSGPLSEPLPEPLLESLSESLPEKLFDDIKGVGGREGVGSWPRGRYQNRNRQVVGPVIAGRPRVDLFALYFFEKHGIWPWQHSAWKGDGWLVPTGYPLAASILGVDDQAGGQDATTAGEVPRVTLPKRDPFRSLFAPLSLQQRDLEKFHRPPGLRGFLIDELDLVAVYYGASGPQADFRNGVTLRPFTLRPGDALWDGALLSIKPTPGHWYQRCGEVSFKQSVQSPDAVKPFRQVIKRIPCR